MNGQPRNVALETVIGFALGQLAAEGYSDSDLNRLWAECRVGLSVGRRLQK